MVDNQQTFLTKEGLQKLQEEYNELKNKKIPAIAARIDEARQQGDLSENAEYQTAREEMAWAQTKLAEFEELLRDVKVIDEGGAHESTVRLGSAIRVKVNGKEKEFRIVGAQEANPAQGLISNESPLGEQLIGSKAGDKISITVPAGEIEYKIISIS